MHFQKVSKTEEGVKCKVYIWQKPHQYRKTDYLDNNHVRVFEDLFLTYNSAPCSFLNWFLIIPIISMTGPCLTLVKYSVM